jgi:hypothetical protein
MKSKNNVDRIFLDLVMDNIESNNICIVFVLYSAYQKIKN